MSKFGSKITLECAIHGLKYEYPGDWDELSLPSPSCSVCKAEKIETLQQNLESLIEHRKTLLNAIELKMNIVVDNF